MKSCSSVARRVLLVGISIVLSVDFLFASHELVSVAGSTLTSNAALVQNPFVNRKKSGFWKLAGGEPAPVGRFPYMCSIRCRNNGGHHCGGTLIHPLWVLTAAHCLDQKIYPEADLLPVVYCGIYEVKTPDDTHVRNETKTADDDGVQIFGTVKNITHQGWKGRFGRGYDIAVLKLDRPAPFQTARYAEAAAVTSTGRFLVGVGWGQTESGVGADVLMMASQLTNLDPGWCEKVIEKKLPKCSICAGGSGQDTCKGDSGGPLLDVYAPDRQIEEGKPDLDVVMGITSYGTSAKCDGELPGIYTAVSCFTDWIRAVIESDVRNE